MWISFCIAKITAIWLLRRSYCWAFFLHVCNISYIMPCFIYQQAINKVRRPSLDRSFGDAIHSLQILLNDVHHTMRVCQDYISLHPPTHLPSLYSNAAEHTTSFIIHTRYWDLYYTKKLWSQWWPLKNVIWQLVFLTSLERCWSRPSSVCMQKAVHSLWIFCLHIQNNKPAVLGMKEEVPICA